VLDHFSLAKVLVLKVLIAATVSRFLRTLDGIATARSLG
jgi:hypothetical protein